MSTTMTPSEPGGQDDLLAELPAFATLITRDGRPVRIDHAADGGIALSIGGRGKEVVFDRFQAAALRDAIQAMAGGG